MKFKSTRGTSFSASRLDATRRMSATELVRAAPSQQRLHRSSDSVAAPSQQRCAQHQLRRSISSAAAALRAASAPSQQYQLRATRRMSVTELVGAAPSRQRLRRSSDSVAARSQQRCAHHERSTGLLGYRLENLPKTGGHHHHSPSNLILFIIFIRMNFPKELRSPP